MQRELKDFLDKKINGDTDTNTVTVFPLPCGVGKSQYVRYAISDAICHNQGLIIITDETERLESYTVSSDESLQEYINRNLDRLAVLRSDNIAEELKSLHRKKIVLMCTQRYFNLTVSEIKELTATRPRIIFDEKPYILETRTITIKNLYDVLAALQEALDDTVNQTDKKWLVEQWQQCTYKLQAFLKENEELNTDYERELYFHPNGLTISDDDVKFNELILRYKHQLMKYNPNVLKDVTAVNQLIKEGVITSQKLKTKKSNNNYRNYFTVTICNTDKLIDIGAKVFVLDGTSDISPEYQLKCVNMIDCSHFKRDLSKLTINIVATNTSKDRLTRKGDKTQKLIKTILDYIKSQPQNIDTIFTYKQIADKFQNDFSHVDWFGHIKGTNKYRNITHICQVGLNRFSDLAYVLLANTIGQYNDGDKSITNRIYDKQVIDDIRCRCILADLEQNIFRAAIRNIDNTERIVYTLICNVLEPNKIFENYQPLINMIKSRYENLGATINFIDTPSEIKQLKITSRKTKKTSSAKIVLNWLDSQHNREFKRADIMRECNLTESQCKEAMRNAVIKEKLNEMTTHIKGRYKAI